MASVSLHHPDCILVGHSLGSVLIARLMTNWLQLRVRAAMLVAPAETHGSDGIGHFGAILQRQLDVPVTVVASRNDPWMSFARATYLARRWGGDLVDAGQVGHINVASGFGPWANGKSLRDRLLVRSARGRQAASLALRGG